MRLKSIFLGAIFCLSLLSACNSNTQQADEPVTENTNLSVAEFETAIAQSNIQLLDVRTPEEYQSGHLKNAFLADWNNEEEFKSRVQALDKSKPVYTYCLSGARSNAAAEWLRANGFTAYNLTGGISAWIRADKPLENVQPAKQITLAEYMLQIPADKTVLVDISAVWCPPCKKMTPVIDSLVSMHGTQFVLVKIDGGQQSDICRELKVEEFPTFIIYKAGKETWRKQGLTDTKAFELNL